MSAMLQLRDDGVLELGAYVGAARAQLDRMFPRPLGPDSGSGVVILAKQVMQFPDLDAADVPPVLQRGRARAAATARWCLRRCCTKDERWGRCGWAGRSPAALPTSKIALLKTFADQAVIAIQNARPSVLKEARSKRGRAQPAESRQRSQERLPGDDEPRDPHADERGHRHDRAAARHAADDEQREFAETIRDSGDALLTIINDILDFSKIEAGRMDVETHAVRPARVRRSGARPDRRPRRREAAGHRLRVRGRRCRRAVSGDVTRLRQILLNLLSNAVKFTDDGRGRADGRDATRASGAMLHFAVRDTGIGMSEARLGAAVPDVQPGRQLDHAQVRRHRAGPGDQQAARRADGRHDVGRKCRPGPRRRPSTSPCAPSWPPCRRARARDFSGHQPQLAGKRMLVVDDNATNRRILALQAAKWGMVVMDTRSARGRPADAARRPPSTWPSSTCTCRAWTAARWPARIRERRAHAAAGAVHLARPARDG